MSKEYGYSRDGKLFFGRYPTREIAVAWGQVAGLQATHTGQRVSDGERVAEVVVSPTSIEPVVTLEALADVTDKEIDRLQKIVMQLEREAIELKKDRERLVRQLEDSPTEPRAKPKKKKVSKQG
jgi:hypothetical protein